MPSQSCYLNGQNGKDLWFGQRGGSIAIGRFPTLPRKKEGKLISYLVSLIILFCFITRFTTFEDIGHLRFKTQNFELKPEMCSWCCRCVYTCIMINHVHTIASFTPHNNLPVRNCSLSIHCLSIRKRML